MTSLWIDLSTSWAWKGSPVGITRTEVMVTRELLAARLGTLRFCRFDRKTRQFLEIPRQNVETHLMGGGALQPEPEGLSVQRPLFVQIWRGWLERWLLHGISYLPVRLQQPLRAWLAALIAVAPASLALLRALLPARRVSRQGGSVAAFERGDSYLSMGLDWDNHDLKVVAGIRKRAGLKVFLFAYDLIPIYHPHYCVPGHTCKFKPYFQDLIACADVVFAISEDTRQQLMRYGRELGVMLPWIRVIRLGSNPPTARLDCIPSLSAKPFILTVGTVEIRKNHRLLYHLWMRMREDPEIRELPVLVMAGRRGWQVDDLFAEMAENPLVHDCIHHLESPSDAELQWLYEHCLFTLFPSMVEGFGLPVVESFVHGKCCLSSNTSSLPEAGQGLSVLLDPLDFPAWYKTIKSLILNPALCRQQEAKIRESFSVKTWRDTADSIARVIEDMA